MWTQITTHRARIGITPSPSSGSIRDAQNPFCAPLSRCVGLVSRDSTIGWVASTVCGIEISCVSTVVPAAIQAALRQSTDTQRSGIDESHSIRSRMEIKCAVDRYADWFVFCELLASRGSVLNCGIYVLS